MTHKFAREDSIDFSITYFMDGQKILVKKDSGIKSVADLAGKKVGTSKGSTSEKNIKEAQPECNVLSFEGYPQAFLALRQGKVSAVRFHLKREKFAHKTRILLASIFSHLSCNFYYVSV